MTLLLTGGRGFIGRSILTSFLSRNHSILAPTHDELDLLDTQAVEDYVLEHRPDVIIHAATVVDKPDTVRINTQMYLNILRMRTRVGWVFNLSSGAAYGAHLPLDNVTEAHLGIITPIGDYGYSKLLISQIGKLMGNVTDLFLFGIYGPLEESFRFPKRAIQHVLNGRQPVVFMDRRMSYLWINDFMEILNTLLILTTTHGLLGPHYNVTPHAPITLMEFGKRIASQLSPSCGIKGVRLMNKGIAESYVGDNTKIRELFLDCGYVWPTTNLEDTIQEMADALKEEI